MTKKDFFRRLEMFTELGEFSFHCSFGSDEYTGKGWQRRTSEFALFVVFKAGNIQIISQRTGKDVFQLKIQLIEKYTRWIEDYLKDKQ